MKKIMIFLVSLLSTQLLFGQTSGPYQGGGVFPYFLGGMVGIVALCVVIIVILVLREVFCWYTKATEHSRLLMLILVELRKANGTKEKLPRSLKSLYSHVGPIEEEGDQ